MTVNEPPQEEKKNMSSAFSDQNHAPSLTSVRLESYVNWN